jgi:hypothetical protein
MRLLRKITRSLRQRGLAGTLVACVRSLPELVPHRRPVHWWDEQCNVDTEEPANIGDLEICPGGDDLSAQMYMPIEQAGFRW